MLADFLAAVIEGLQAQLPEDHPCALRGGRLRQEELKRLDTVTPGVFISVTTLNGGHSSDSRHLALSLMASVVCRDQNSVSKDLSALGIIETLHRHIPSQTWGLDSAHPASRCRASNRHSAELDSCGLALWELTWQQTLQLEGSALEQDRPRPTEIYLGINPQEEQDYRPLEEICDVS